MYYFDTKISYAKIWYRMAWYSSHTFHVRLGDMASVKRHMNLKHAGTETLNVYQLSHVTDHIANKL